MFKKVTIKISKIILNIFGILFAVIALLIIFSLLPVPGNVSIFSVQTGSMEPAIMTGSIIFTKSYLNYEPGDIVTKKIPYSKNTITHRIVDKLDQNGKNFFRTKGDANDAADMNPVSEEEIIGKTVFVFPYLGYLVNFGKTKTGIILLIIIPATIMIYEEFRKVRYELEKSKRFKELVKAKRGLGKDVFFPASPLETYPETIFKRRRKIKKIL